MARYIRPSCRLCRREGIKLFLKGAKCQTDKCPVSRRAYAPGQHGAVSARKKESNYGVQLREKQKVKRIYGVLEKQFKHYFRIAEKAKGVTGITLLQLLERRIDNVIFRMNLAQSRAAARQLVGHGSVYVNGRRVDIPSYTVKVGDTIILKVKEPVAKRINETREVLKDRPMAKWLGADPKEFKATIADLPTKADVGFPIQEQLIVELYSK
ncbi:MAG: 30S ribosomal protein S4 [Candidatus Omnitrophota bacterium]